MVAACLWVRVNIRCLGEYSAFKGFGYLVSLPAYELFLDESGELAGNQSVDGADWPPETTALSHLASEMIKCIVE